MADANRSDRCLARLKGKGFAPAGILDVGAHDGWWARTARAHFPDARILMVDALAEKEATLRDACAAIGNAEFQIVLLGDKDLPAVPFFVVNAETANRLTQSGSSKFRENTSFPVEERSVPQRSLRSLLASSQDPFELLKLDVQGAELDVLRGAQERLSAVQVIMMEIALVQFNRGAPLIDKVLAGMAEFGFVLYDIVEEHRYPAGEHLLPIDGIFARPDSHFRLHPPIF